MITSRLLQTIPFIDHQFVVKDYAFSHTMPTTVHQIHGTTIVQLTPDVQKIDADGIYTQDSRQSIGVNTADCVPILLVAPSIHTVMAIHAGWRGTLFDISSHAITTLVKLGEKKQNIIAAIGPSIGPCCYSISSKRAQKFNQLYGSKYTHCKNGKTYLDLQRINCDQLISSGMTERHIDILSYCTYCSSLGFYSYRKGDIHNRMISYITLSA